MLQLVYLSTFGLHSTASDVIDILDVSRSNNRRDGITGLLIADGIRFLQVLEGDEASVNAALERISKDTRHFAVHILSTRNIEEREFGNWDMAYEHVSEVAEGLNLADRVDAMVAHLADEPLRTRLSNFARLGQGSTYEL